MDIGSIEEMNAFAKKIIAELETKKEAVIIGLKGDLGAGKTTFVQCVARALGVKEAVTSPTFVIQKKYPLQNQTFDTLVHIDAYRIEDPHELEVLRWNHTIEDSKNLILIEWPEKVASLLPNKMKMIHFIYTNEENREVTVEN